MNGSNGIPDRDELRHGDRVLIIRKRDQGSGKLTEGILKKFLTTSPRHPHGIKVMLESGIVGRVQEVIL